MVMTCILTMEIHATGLVYILLIAFLLMVQVYTQTCNERCASCTSRDVCTSCKEGYYSYPYRNCGKQCRNTCKSCTSRDVCNSCKDGYYKGKKYPTSTDSYSYCRHQCRYTCKSCTSRDVCTSCKDGYYSYSQSNCGNQCRNTCKSCTAYDTCTECKSFYYGQNCTFGCPTNCLSCTSIDHCTACKNGYYNVDTVDTCTGNCRTNCKSCTPHNDCTECFPGYYGSDCSRSCSSNCVNNMCDKSDGNCKTCPSTCSSCTSSSVCTSCVDGYYSSTYNSNCPHSCSPNCKSCSSFNNCKECKPHYYGTYCDNTCFGCIDRKCDKGSGICTTGCKSGFTGTICDECQAGFYGTTCNVSCKSKNCYGNKCHRYTGTCTSCSKSSYGDLCQHTCSINCKNGGFCYMATGKCTHGCNDGYSGDMCCLNNAFCKTCASNTECSECVDSKYGETCQNACPANCNANKCNLNGACISCRVGFYGNLCNQSCPDRCVECNMSGSCMMCEPGYFGTSCDLCPESCSECQSLTWCSSCVDGYYGMACEHKCQCNGGSCDKNNGNCKKCPSGKTGLTCNNDCSVNCNSCHINSNDYCLTCKDEKYGVGSCSHVCPINCLNGKCKMDTGYCYNCTEEFSGNKCDCPMYCNCEHYNCSSCKQGFINTNKKCECRKDMCSTINCDTSCKDNTWYLDRQSQYCCQCSKNCKNRECKSSNECTLGCNDGFYGQNCDRNCSSLDQNCLKCIEQTEYQSSCIECKSGNFLNNRTKRCTQCNTTCLNKECSTTTGLCTNGCKIGYWGDFCQNTCNRNCWKCSRYNGSCEVCSDGRYSLDCSLSCNDGCNQSNGQTLCKITDGACLFGCLSGNIYGKTCTLNCSENCFSQNCEWETGHCSNGCINNRYGEKCDRKCSDHCLSKNETISRCHQQNGSCLSGCTSGYHGDKCENACSTNCKNTTCRQSSGECMFGCNDGFTKSTCTQVLAAIGGSAGTGGDSSNGAVIGGAVGGVVFIALAAALVVVVLCVVRKRRCNRKPRLDDKPQFDNASHVNQNNARLNDPGPIYNTNLESVNLYSSVMETEESTAPVISNTNYQPPPENLRMSTHSVISNVEVEEEDEPDYVHPPIPNVAADKTYYNVVRRVHVDKLAEYVTKKQSEDYEEEFQEFKHGLVEGISYADSQKRANVGKNRYRSIYPYDEHRVRLIGKGTDYINASYIDGYHKQNAYIACLGPMEKNTDKFVNFWRMVWQTKVEKVVMVTNLYENGSNKCDQYWPNTGKSVIYGDVTVTCHSEDVYADYTVRSFSVSSMSENRKLNHIHYTAWPDKGVPDDVTSLIEFRQKVISTTTSLDGPTIVHCSAGVGRTGTYIALDILTTEGEQHRTVDIFGCVEHMREHRVNMVQTAEQYEYLHNALVHTLTFDSHAIPGDTFQAYYTSISDSEMTKKFEQIQNSKEEKTKDEIKAINRNKTRTKSNRPHSDIPGDLHRPKLSLLKTSGSSDYINAVYINSFKTKNRFIVAQTPLPGTAVDFVSLIFQTNCSCIVSMEPVERLKDKTVGTYFPADNQELNIGHFKITSAKGETRPLCILRKLTIVKQGQSGNNKRTVHHYQYTQWQSGKLVPDNAAALLQMVRDVDKKAHESSEAGQILIHCLNGGEKSGLFCVVTMLIEKMEIEHEVSVVNCVRMVKSRRGNAIPNKEQFSFCYQCVNAYLQSFDIYSNFSLRI